MLDIPFVVSMMLSNRAASAKVGLLLHVHLCTGRTLWYEFWIIWMKVTALHAQSKLFAIPLMEKRWCIAEICVGVHEEGQMIRLVCNLESNISIIYSFAFAEKSGMSFSCFACVFVCVQGAELLNWNPKCAGVPCTLMTGKCFVGDYSYWWLS